ncbi:sensor histidine kinase [Streptomyces sp. NPDC004232]|uniref:sensor histidine kinase n=1 Tax=Streptomyces sp. NPDC004232 TaxID=3154454 RepID=UPI0033BBC74A
MGIGALRQRRGRVGGMASGGQAPDTRPALEPDSGGLSLLCVLLGIPLANLLALPPGRAAVGCAGLAVFAVLYVVGQRLTPRAPLALRGTLFGCLTLLAFLGMAMFTTAWLTTAILAAVSAANLLPLMLAAVGGVAVVTVPTALAGASAQAVLTVAAAGVIAVLRGRLMVEIAQSRANRHAHAMAAVENERLRIARDLHDLLGHSLTTMVVKAELAERLAGRDPEASAGAARDVQQVGRAAMTHVQQAVAGYRSASLDEEAEQARQSLLPLRDGVTLEIPPRTWSRETDAVLAWGLREAVTNILRHANAGRCEIAVHAGARTVRLTVANNDLGRGPVAPPMQGGGHGLVGLRERATEMGGQVDTARLPGGWFRLVVEVPLDSGSGKNTDVREKAGTRDQCGDH